eukprot:TRINITY_DN4658_c6_g1_i1.p1 TRINITY_DN4658_c6_g1~~TRINITY_DN4658_c6_g1_i1.p1  ORF type:complete len:285 (+),score=45.65 TRINITY_DN4658_c6_g1_i1:95-856(+)
MARTAELRDFDDQLYSVTSKPSATSSKAKQEDSDPAPAVAATSTAASTDTAYLIATSEQPISALHQDESLDPAQLPIRYVGTSPCFRAETSSRGLDAKGLFRVHQFEKVEQFCICSPDYSWDLLEEMLQITEEFYQSLGLPYRIVSIASGSLNDAAAKKYDLEAWFSVSGEFRELVSCSNCTDFQSRALGVRLDEGKQSRHVHMLNSTLCATERTMCCLLEAYQEADGVRIPQVLVPYMHGQEFIRFTEPVST